MKKILALSLVVSLVVLALASCGGFDPAVKSEGVMSYDEYVAAELDTEVTIEAFVQAKQSWWTDDEGVSKATFYLQDTEGGYFVYDLPCSEEDYNKMTVGTRVQIKGYKSEWKGEIEIIDATFKILNGTYVATPVDVTAKLGTDELINYQNRAVEFKGMTIEASNADGAAFLYGWDGSGTEGGDIYFNASVNGEIYTFVIESYLTGKDTDVYKAAQALKVGDVVDLGGYLYWYNGAQPHIVSIKSTGFNVTDKSEGVMSYDEYVAAELDTEVTIEAFVQAKQSWWTDDEGVSKATFYLQDTDGAYFAYDLPCSEEDYSKMTVGTRVQIKGYKSEWKGEIEIIDATFKILNGTYVATPVDVTAKLGTDELINYQNRKVDFSALTIVASNEAGAAFLYGWDGNGTEGGDIYFKASVNGETYTFVIESYLTGKDTDVYKAAQALKVGDVVDLNGYLYWYNGAQPHIVSIAVVG